MLYTKNENKRYVDMCAEFDREFWSADRDDSKLYKYLYLLFYMYSCKGSYFKRFEDYDGYAQFAATTIYMRFLKKLRKGEKIKSVKNYVDKTKNYLKVMYQNQEFATVLNPELEGIDTTGIRDELKNSIQADYNTGLIEEIEESLETITTAVKNAIENTHFVWDPLLCHRLYLSCMLTLLNSITLPNQTIKELKTRRKIIDESKILTALTKERDSDVILWNLDREYSDFVRMLVNTARKQVSEVINDTRQSYALPDDVIESILSSAYVEGIQQDESEDDYE